MAHIVPINTTEITKIRGGRSHILRLCLCSCSKCVFRIRVPKVLKFEKPTLVQTPVTIDATEIQQCFYLK